MNDEDKIKFDQVAKEIDDPAFLHWDLTDIDFENMDVEELVSDFEWAYLGKWVSLVAYAESYVREFYNFDEELALFIDYEGYWNSLQNNGLYYSFGDDGYYIFRSKN